jgi:hypothetical protein
MQTAFTPAISSFADAIGQKLGDKNVQETLKKVGEKMGAFAEKITDKLITFLNSDSFDKFADSILKLGDAITSGVIWLVETGLPSIQNTLDWMTTHRDDIAAVMAAIGTGLTVAGAASGNIAALAAGTGLLAGSTQVMSDAMKDLGINTDPSLKGLIDNISGLKKGREEVFRDAFSEYVDPNMINITNGFYTMKSAIEVLTGWFNNEFKTSVDVSFIPSISSLFGNIDSLRQLLDRMKTDFPQVWDSMSQKLKEFAQPFADQLMGVYNALNTVFFEPMRRAIQGLIDLFNDLFNKQSRASSVSGSHGGGGTSFHAEGVIFNQPTLIPALNGLHVVGEAGAEITAPLAKLEATMINAVQRSGGSGKTVNLYIQPQSMTDAQWRRGVTIIRDELGLGYA